MTETFDNKNAEAIIRSHLDFNERYSDLCLIGGGGMGSIFRAQDNKLSIPVAIKVLRAGVDAKAIMRFQQEARSLSLLKNRFIVGVLDLQGSKNGDMFLLMEYVDGDSLEKIVAEHGPLPLEDVVKYAVQLCVALEHAHKHGVVHRDLKPSNIMIDSNRNVRILDFGIAKLLSDTDQSMTRAGVPIGTPAYMSPEQVRGDKTDERTDVFGLGLLIYTMAAGRSPFDGEQVLDYYKNLLGKTIPSLRLWIGESDVAHRIDRIVAKAMQSDPDARFQNMTELRAELDALSANPVDILQVTHGFDDKPAERPKRAPLLLIGVIALSVLSALVLHISTERPKARTVGGVTKMPVPDLESSSFEEDSQADIDRSIKYDGKLPPKFGTEIVKAEELLNFVTSDESVTSSDLKKLNSSVRNLSLVKLTLTPDIIRTVVALPVVALDLTGAKFANSDLKEFAKMPRLRWLRLDRTETNIDGIRNLAPLKNTLTHLDLDFCKAIDDTAVATIVETFPNLRSLHIGDCKVTRKAIGDIGKLKYIRSLWLSSMDVTDADVKALSHLNFAILDLSDCPNITDETLAILSTQFGIKHLELTHCSKISTAAANEWQRQHKNTKLYTSNDKELNDFAGSGMLEEPEALK